MTVQLHVSSRPARASLQELFWTWHAVLAIKVSTREPSLLMSELTSRTGAVSSHNNKPATETRDHLLIIIHYESIKIIFYEVINLRFSSYSQKSQKLVLAKFCSFKR